MDKHWWGKGELKWQGQHEFLKPKSEGFQTLNFKYRWATWIQIQLSGIKILKFLRKSKTKAIQAIINLNLTIASTEKVERGSMWME